jgi:L-malate glycosyltransferase
VRRPLLVAHTAAPGGSGEVLLALLEHRPAGVEPAVVFLTEGPLVRRARALGVPTAIVPAGAGRQLHLWPGLVRRLRGAIRAHRADLVFAHHAKAQLYAGPAARLEGVPALWWRHSRVRDERHLDAVVDRLPTDLVVCSSEQHAELQRRHSPGRAVAVVHPGTPLPPLEPRPDGLAIGIAGRLQRLKAVERLLYAAPAVLAAEPSARFVVIGGAVPGPDADYEAELQALARELGIAGAVAFTGHLPDAPSRIGELAVLAHACEQESFGLVIVEAMARAVPVVVPDAGGPVEIVRHGTDGLRVDVTDPAAFSAALLDLLRDPGRRAAMGAAARERVAERFTVERMAERAWSLAAGLAGS